MKCVFVFAGGQRVSLEAERRPMKIRLLDSDGTERQFDRVEFVGACEPGETPERWVEYHEASH